MAPSELGAFLQASREAMGLTLDEIETRTHIRRIYLEALEEGDWDALPPGVYTRGLLRSYAKAVGASEKSALRYYLKERPNEAKLPEPQLISQPLVEEPRYSNEMLLAVAGFALAAVLLVWLVKTEFTPLLDAARDLLAQEAGGAPEVATFGVPAPSGTPPSGAARPTSTPQATTGRSLGTPVGGFVGAGLTPGVPAGTAGSATATNADAGTAAPTSVFTDAASGTGAPGATSVAAQPGGAVTAPAPRGTPAAGLRMAVTATGRVWLRVIADGEEVYAGFMQEGEGQSWTAREAVEVRTGNAGGTQVTLNGQVLERLGADGVVLSCSWRLLATGTIEQTC